MKKSDHGNTPPVSPKTSASNTYDDVDISGGGTYNIFELDEPVPSNSEHDQHEKTKTGNSDRHSQKHGESGQVPPKPHGPVM